jgi:mRNA interferase HicA
MNGDQFIRQVRKWARAHDTPFEVKADEGKGSHRKVFVASRWTTVKHSEISKPLLAAMLKQLNIPREEF